MRSVKDLILPTAVVAMLVVPALTFGAEATRHSGTVVSVDAKSRALVVDELGAAGKEQRLHVRLTPDAHVVLSERNPHATDAQSQFTDRSISLDDVKPGDFVVVALTGHGKTTEADSVTVTLQHAASK